MANLRLSFVLTLALLAAAGCTALPNNGEIIQVEGNADHLGAKKLTQAGIQHVKGGDMALAKSTFQQAIRVDDTHGPAHNNLGRVYFQSRDLQRAAEAFTWAMEFMPSRPEPVNNLAMVYEAGGKVDKAIELFRKAHIVAPDNSEYLANLVRARLRRGDRGDDLREQLQALKFIEVRPEWSAWVDQQLAASFDGPNKSPSTVASQSPTAFELQD